MGVVNSKYFISAWNEVIQSNGHNFWTVCHIALQKSQNEENLISFYVHLIAALQLQNAHFMAISLVQKKNIFSHKNWKQVKHELVTWWSWYFLSNLFLRLSSTHAWFLHTLGAHNLMTKNTMTTYVGCVSLTKSNIQFLKDDFCL